VLESAKAAHPGLAEISWESELIGAPPAKAIADVADVRHADEIILGTRGFGRVRALLGSVAHEVIHLASCPVTVIRSGWWTRGYRPSTCDTPPSTTWTTCSAPARARRLAATAAR
jgi:hypothetical protein